MLGGEQVPEVDLPAHAFLPAVDFEGHLEVHLLGLVGQRFGVEGEGGEQAESLREGYFFGGVGELDGISLVHFDCAFSALGLLAAEPEDGDLQFEALLELGLQSQRLEVERNWPVYDHHQYNNLPFASRPKQQPAQAMAMGYK